MIKVTYEQLMSFRPCHPTMRKVMFKGRKTLDAKRAFKVGASIRDLCWVAQKLGEKDLLVKFALRCAQSVAHLNPDPRVQAALDATQAWLDNPSQTTQKAAYATYAADAAAANAADAAYATYAADAAANAAYAADAAANAADAAAYAADAAANASDAAAYAADAAADAAYASDAADAAADAADAAADAAYAAADAAYVAAIERQKQWFVEIFS